MSFDPTTAVPVEEPPEFDPTTAAPVEESRLLGQFDPSTAAPMSAEDEVALVNQYLSPDYVAQSKEEFAQLRKLENDLKDQGTIPGDFENAVKGVGGIFVSVIDAANSLVTSPADSWRRSPATIQTGVGKAALGAMELGGFVSRSVIGKPQYKTADTGEYVYKPLGGLAPLISTGDESQKNLVPMTEDDILEYDFQQYLAKKGIEKENKELETKTAPTEFVSSLFVGSRQETPNLAQAETISLGADPTNWIPLGAGAKTMGMSRGAKLVSSKAARALEKSAIAASEGIDNVSQGVVNKIQDITGLTEQSQKTAATVVAGGVGLAGGGAMLMSDADPATKTALTTAATVMPLVFRYGAATLRKVGSGAAGAKIILREAADATNGLDQAARASVLANPAVPQAYKDILENPTRFRPIESTPARLAADPRLGKQTRAVMDRLSNPLIVQGVRGASAVAGGAAKGTLANAPFAAAAYGAGENDDAATMLLGGATFGAIGGTADRITGLQQRRAEARASDTARMLIDVELAGGDVAKLSQTYSPQQLGDLASMQGFFRDKVEFVPLSKADFDLNTKALGGAGAAGLHVQAPPGEKARIFINLDAKREGIVPHELGHALIKSGAIGGMQADSIRAFTTRRYTQAGVEARAREYATTMIANENAAKFPGQNLAISPDTINAKMDELGQSGLLRGDTDPLDWARDEIFAEDFRQASQTMDFAAIRRNLPAEGSWLGMMEGILGAQANALSISGVRIDPVTGQPDPLFKANPILETDPVLKKQVGQYLNNYRQWVNHPDQTKARGVRVAPAARPQDLVNNPLVTFHDYGGGVMANEFARIDPATGQAILRDQRDINAETAKRQEQMKALVGSKAISPKDPVLGPKKIKDENGRDTGRTTTRGRLLPQNFDFLNGFAQHQRGFARQLETAAANGESLMVRYHAIGTGDSGSFRVKNLGNLEAITREVIPWGWELTSKGNLLASVLDLTQFRNRAIKAINAGDPTIDRLYNNDIKLIESDLKQWMDNHRQDLPGSNKIGEQRRDAINSLIGIATNVNKGANPFSGKIAGPGSAIKSFRLDRMDAATGTGRTGFHFDYDKANGNLLPEIPTPLPDLSQDLPGQAMPDVKMPDGRIVDNWSKVKNGDNWNTVKRFLPSEDVDPPVFPIGRSKDEVVENAARFLLETKSATDRSGVTVLLSNPQTRGGYSDKIKNRAEHATGRELKKGSSVRELDPEKAQWVAAVPDTIQNAPVKVYAGSEVLYFRKYRKRTHMVVTTKEGVFLDQEPFDSGFVTQYPLELRNRQFKGVAKVEILPPPAAVSGSPTNATTNATPATTDAVDQAGSVGTPGDSNLSGVESKSRPQGQAMLDVDANTGLPLNKNGTVTIFHATTAEKAARIRKEGILRSEAEPDVYFSTAKDGTGYGDGTVVAVQIDPKKLQLDDEFPDGRKDFRVSVGKAKQLPIKIENVFTPGQAMPDLVKSEAEWDTPLYEPLPKGEFTVRLHHGTWRGGYDSFKDGSHFSKSKKYASRYMQTSASSMGMSGLKQASKQEIISADVTFKKVFDTRNPADRKIFEQEFYRKYGTGTPVGERGLPDWTDAVDLAEFLEESHPKYDGIVLDEGGEPLPNGEVRVRPEVFVPLKGAKIKIADRTPLADFSE
jgi:hypothetical protein